MLDQVRGEVMTQVVPAEARDLRALEDMRPRRLECTRAEARYGALRG
jgi:hypothetical protein